MRTVRVQEIEYDAETFEVFRDEVFNEGNLLFMEGKLDTTYVRTIYVCRGGVEFILVQVYGFVE